MWLRLALAFRNTFRHKRRTLLNLCMIAGGISMLLIFEGFVHRLMIGLQETTVRTQTGHLQIAKSGFWNKSLKSPKDGSIAGYHAVIRELSQNPHVRYASGRIQFFGMLAKREKNVSAQGVSFDPKVESSRNKSFKFVTGSGLKPSKPYQIALGYGLAKKLGTKSGDSLVVMSQTYDGVVNALDMEVSGIFRTAISDFDDNTFLIGLSSAQKLLDTTGVEMIVVGLDSTLSTLPIRNVVSKILARKWPDLQVQPWYKQAKLYTQVVGFNRIQNRLFQMIILTLVLLSILNTIGMSVFERTSEIGTLRAMGERRVSIVVQFLMEGAILGMIGGALGMVLGIMMAYAINWLEIPVIMPGASIPLKIQVVLTWTSIKGAWWLAILTTTLASVIPAVRASRMKVIDALS